MQRCLELAALGKGSTYPNPMVGSVIVHNGLIIGEGWHHKAGEPHAEVNAIESVQNKKLLKESTIYVSLEPCAHFGKTPPCSLRIIEEGIPKVVVATVDPHSAVAGKGIEMLREKGVEVRVGILEEEARNLNAPFFTFHKEKRPYVTLKMAVSSDGFLAPDPNTREANEPAWITGYRSKQRVHKLRSEVDAILVGGKTIVMDNPSLTTRLWPGKSPQRIIWTNRPIDGRNTVMNDGNPTWVVGPRASEYGYEAPIETWNTHTAMELLHELFERQITHVLVEGGASTIQKFLEDEVWDEAWILNGKVAFESGIKAPVLESARKVEEFQVDNDLWQRFERV